MKFLLEWEGRVYTQEEFKWQLKEFENKGEAPDKLYELFNILIDVNKKILNLK